MLGLLLLLDQAGNFILKACVCICWVIVSITVRIRKELTDICVTFKRVACISSSLFLRIDWYEMVFELILDEFLIVEDLSQVLLGVIIQLI